MTPVTAFSEQSNKPFAQTEKGGAEAPPSMACIVTAIWKTRR